MLYSDLYFRSKSRPSIVLVLMSFVAVIGFALVFVRFNISPTQASKKQLKYKSVVNLSATQAGIYWQTDAPEVGWVVYGAAADTLDKTEYDERDLETNKKAVTQHYVLLSGLQPNTTYYYKIVSNNQVVADGSGKPFTVTTVLPFTGTSLKPVYGKVLKANSEPATDAFVFLNYKQAVPLVAITKVTGEFLIPLQYMIDANTLKSIPITENDIVNLEVIDTDSTRSKITAIIKKLSPLPQSIVMGKNYTFTQENDVLPASTVRSANTHYSIDILYPKENAIIPGVRPLVKGLALPKSLVKVTLNTKSPGIFTTYADEKGDWRVTISNQVPTGRYTLTMETADENQKPVSVAHNFVIASAGNQVLGTSTQSAQPTATPTSVPTPTTVRTATSTPTPTTGFTSTTPTVAQTIPTSTPIPTVIAAISSTPTPTSKIITATATATPPVTGSSTLYFAVASVAMVALGVGLIVIF